MGEFIVLGGGVVGVSIALRLAIEGGKVTVLERSSGVSSATTHSAGVVTVQLDSVEDAITVKKSIEILEEIIGDSDPLEAGVVGREFVAIEDEEDSEETAEILEEAGIEFEQLSSVEASEKWPQIRFNDGEVATHTWIDASIEPKKFLRFLYLEAAERGVALRLNNSVKSLEVEDGEVVAAVTNDGEVYGDVFFLCLGPWNKSFLADLGITLPTWIIRCPAYRFRVSGCKGLPAFSDDINDSYWRLGFRDTLVGGGYHAESAESPEECFGRPPREFTEDTERLLGLRLRCGFELIEDWTGPCSISPDFKPIIDLVEGFRNLYVVDGLRGYGLMKGLALGFSLAEKVLGRKPEINLSRYTLKRLEKFF